jgi:hypothetical protein
MAAGCRLASVVEDGEVGNDTRKGKEDNDANEAALSAWQATNPSEKKTKALRIGLIIAGCMRVDRHARQLTGKIRKI